MSYLLIMKSFRKNKNPKPPIEPRTSLIDWIMIVVMIAVMIIVIIAFVHIMTAQFTAPIRAYVGDTVFYCNDYSRDGNSLTLRGCFGRGDIYFIDGRGIAIQDFR